MWVTSTSEVLVPSALDFILVLLDKLLSQPEVAPVQTVILSQLDPGFHPKLGLPLCRVDVDVHPRLLSREEEEPETPFSEDGRAQSTLLDRDLDATSTIIPPLLDFRGGLVAILESKINRGEAFERQAEHWRRRVEEIREQEDRIRLGGGLKAQDKQRAQGKMTARERVEALCDPGSDFLELGLWVAEGFYQEYGGAPAAGVVVGIGKIHGRDVVVVSNDATVKAGAWCPLTCKKVLRAQEIALENRLPIVYLVDSAGVFLPLQDEIFPDKEHFGRAFYNNARLSAEGVFQMAAIMGSCVAGGAYLPIMSDESHIVEGTGSIFLAGAHLVQAAIGEKIDNEELGGAIVQCDVSGVVDHRHPSDAACLEKIRSQFAQLAAGEQAPFARRAPAEPLYPVEDLYGIMPVDRSRPYDTHEVLARLLDGSELDEYKATYGQTLVC